MKILQTCSNSCCSEIKIAFSTNVFSVMSVLNDGKLRSTLMVGLYGFTIEL